MGTEEKSGTETVVTQLFKQLEEGEFPGTLEVLQARQDPKLVGAYVKAFAGQTPVVRRAGILLAVELGRPILLPEGIFSERPAPYIGDPAIVKFLVDALADEDADVRDAACQSLVWDVPDPLLRDHNARLIELLKSRPATNGAALVLGKTGAESARLLIEGEPDLREANPLQTQFALARLGDREGEDAALKSYANEKDLTLKAELARGLGYLATPRAILTLAGDIRTDQKYIWLMQSSRSMRVHIIEGLHAAFPAEPIFWRPPFKPEDDSYYQAIEDWLTRNLGVKWENPRPEFLYEEDAPVPAPPEG